MILGGIGELFHPESFHGINQQGRQQQQQDQTMPINQIHMSDLAMSRGDVFSLIAFTKQNKLFRPCYQAHFRPFGILLQELFIICHL